MTIQDILQHKDQRPVLVRPTETVLAAVRLMEEHGVSAIIVEDDHLRPHAIFTERDFARSVAKYGAAALALPIGPLASAPIISVPPAEKVDTALATMTRAHIRHLAVMESGELLSLISIGDLARYRLREKELEANVLLDLSRRHA